MIRTDPLTLGLLCALGLLALAWIIHALWSRRMTRRLAINSRSLEEEILTRLDRLVQTQDRDERMLRDEFSRTREEAAGAAKGQREELGGALKNQSETALKSLGEISGMLRAQLDQVTGQARRLTDNVDTRLKELREENTQQIEKMRATVDEKLQGTLERRLSESFKLVSDRLEQVHQGLGAMQQLASDVGGLQRVLTNVKTRGGWGEVQLGALLEQMLTPEQFARNVRIRDESGEMVDFAVRLPGDESGAPVWLPIDAKFPVEDFQRLTNAQEGTDTLAIEGATKNLETALRKNARDICSKYINPPQTTDFAIMFLPTEGLYAEAIRRIGLVEQVQREYRVTLTGPTTLAALLNSLQMGFRTLTIQKRSSEVWNLLAKVRTDFGKFAGLLDGVKKKLDQASNQIDDVARKSKAIEKHLNRVEELPSNPQPLLPEMGEERGREEEDV